MSPDEILRSGKEQGIFDDSIMAELRDESLQDGSERKDATGLLSELRTVSGKRKLIKEARARWLGEGAKNGMMTSNLALAWSYREDALAEGTPDIPNEILSWAAENMFEKYVRKKQAEDPSGRIPSEAERIEYKPLTSELVRRYSPEASLQAFVRYKAAAESGFNGPPELKAGKTEVTMDDGSSYSFELLEKSDPRGFTIGVDTGCCMKLGGQAESCVWAGFEDPSFGFIAVYKDGKLRGQSVVYVGDKTGEGDKDTLVIDNIEANKGTDMVNLTAVYQQGVRQLLDQGALSPSIKQINLGTGNSDVDYGHLEVTEPVLHNKPVYTDAERQRLLMSV